MVFEEDDEMKKYGGMMMKSLMICLMAVLFLAAGVQGSTISYVGADLDGGAAQWRTDSVDKPLDIDGDNIYGSYAAVHWTIVGNYSAETIGYVGTGFQYGGTDGYVTMENLADPSQEVFASIIGGYHTFSIGSEAPSVIRVGVMHDCLTEGEAAADEPMTLSLALDSDPENTIVTITTEQANHALDIYFFDIVGAAAGETYTISGIDRTGQVAYHGPITWDVPEPMTMLLMGLGGLSLIRKRN